MEDKTKIIIAAISGIVILEAVALFNGINGSLLALVVAAISGLAGYILPSPLFKSKQ